MKNKTNILFGLIAMMVFSLGIINIASANTYQFVNTSGQLSTVVANNPQEALTIAHNLGLHSGVMLVTTNTTSNNQTSVGQGSNSYIYINTSGQISTVKADSPQEALRTAYQLGPHSGVMLVR